MKVILTGEHEEIVPLSNKEITLIEQSKLDTAKEKASEAKAAADKLAAKAKLEALGLTGDDLKALGL
jgi:ribosomal protein L17